MQEVNIYIATNQVTEWTCYFCVSHRAKHK